MAKGPAVPTVKVQTPRRAGGTLLRTRLLNALHDSVDRKLQVVIAPAGFGKTTLLVDFVHDLAFPTCWVTLDSSDRDVAAYLETLIASLRRRTPGFGARTLAALRGAPDVDRRISALARAFVAEVEEEIESLSLLLLDDYHEVNDSSSVTQFMDEVLRLLPDNLRIVLAGRTLPALTVSRLMVEGQFFGLGEADLRFTQDELLTLVRRHQGQGITPEQAAALAQGADGWIAGFLLSVPRLWDGLVGGMIAARGGEGPLYDYLASEAFDRQPAELQRFLLATAVPEIADTDLCVALLGPGPWRAMVDQVEGAGLFITRLRDGRGGFRYHQLFRDFLRTRLQRGNAAEYARLNTLAAEQMVAREQWPAALRHYREAGEHEAAAALVERIAPVLERGGRWRLLTDAVAALSPVALAAHPRLLLAGARAAVMIGDLSRAEALAGRTRDAGHDRADPPLEAWGNACLGNALRLQGRTREALVALQRARTLSPDDEEMLAAVRRDAGQCLGVQGDFAGAAEELREAVAWFDRAGAAYDAARTEFGLGVALARSGRMAEAIARYEATLERWRKLGDPGMEAEMLNCLGYAYAGRGDYPRARETLQEGLTRARDAGYPRTEAATLHSLGDVLVAAGDIAGARAVYDEGLAVAQETGELWMVAELYAGLALVHAFDGDLVRGEELVHHAIALAQRQDSRYLEALYSLTLGAIQARTGRADTAVTTLTTAATTLDGMGARRELPRAHLWLVHACDAARDPVDARAHLEAALAQVESLGSDAILDLYARWNPEPFARAVAQGVATTRLRAVLERVHAPPVIIQTTPIPLLPALSVAGFGPGSLTIDGRGDVAWPWDKCRELFFLLLHGGARRQEQVLAALWPEAPPVKAKASLHTAVYRLRRAVLPPALVIRGGVYRINEELVTSYDVRDFERSLRSAAETSGDEAVDLLAQAVALYTAPFLDGLDAEWCVEERERLERRLLIALENLADAHAAAGRPRDSIAAAERLLARDPLREDMHARIIRAYLRLGDRAAALRRFEQCAETLREELGVEPGPELQALARRITA